jgi:hypothetical protein
MIIRFPDLLPKEAYWNGQIVTLIKRGDFEDSLFVQLPNGRIIQVLLKQLEFHI